MMKRIFVYSDKGTSAASVKNTISWLKKYTYLEVSPIYHNEMHLLQYCELLVIPGGRDVPYCELLSAQSNKISSFMYNGGKYLGICAGAYFASSFVEFELNTPHQVVGKRPLQFFNGTAKGTIYPNFEYHSEKGAHIVALTGLFQTSCYYNGGPMFFANNKHDHTKICSYENNQVAILQTSVGKGTAVLSGVHLEYDSHDNATLNKSLLETRHTRNALNEHILYNLFQLPKTPTTLDQTNEEQQPIYIFDKHLLQQLSDTNNIVVSDNKSFTIQNHLFDFSDVLNNDNTYNIIFAPILDSTQTWLMNALKPSTTTPTICMALQQTGGLGRSHNSWVSFMGCLQATMFIKLKMDPKKLLPTQLIVANAIITAIYAQNKAFAPCLKLKWPNDIIDIQRQLKIGGILINSDYSVGSKEVSLYIGFGINVFNQAPTGCLSEIGHVNIMQLLKDIIKEIHTALNIHENSPDIFDKQLKQAYQSNWAHEHQTIAYLNEKMMIYDVADNGNLLARNEHGCYEISSNGNQFDFWNHMMVQKQSNQ